jgi:hypothetical protein
VSEDVTRMDALRQAPSTPPPRADGKYTATTPPRPDSKTTKGRKAGRGIQQAKKDEKVARKEAKQHAKAGKVLPDDHQEWKPPDNVKFCCLNEIWDSSPQSRAFGEQGNVVNLIEFIRQSASPRNMLCR